MPITVGSLLIYLLILFRIMGCIMLLPFFGQGMMIQVKGALSIMLALLLFPATALGIEAPALDFSYVVLAAEEVLTGLIMGFVVQLAFNIITVAGEIASQEMGFKMASQMDPITGMQIPSITQFYNLFAILLFLGINGHYWVLEILSRSFRLAPIGSLSITSGFGEWFANLFSRFFSMGIRLSAPIFLLMLMISVGVGLLAKLVEGINVFDIGFPVRIGMGLLFIMFFIPFMAQTLQRAFVALNEGLMNLLMAI
ncbi:MAG: flagellar biosynthetic protein FliR [Planctomycetota bacterium]